MRHQRNLSATERADFDALLADVDSAIESGGDRSLAEILADHDACVDRLLDVFHEDIGRFLASPQARLMHGLHPAISIDEARRMVDCGLTRPGAFLWRARFQPLRRRLAKKLAMPEERLEELYYSTAGTVKYRWGRRVKAGAMVVIVVVVVLNLFAMLGDRLQVSYRPVAPTALEVRPLSDLQNDPP